MIVFRIPRSLDELIRVDLHRPHSFAYERIGFLLARSVPLGESTKLLLAIEYRAVPDDQYIDDESVGARINGDAVREAMQWAMDTNGAVFHIHMHMGKGVPGFSRTDLREIPPIVASIQKVVPDMPHGMIVLNAKRPFGFVIDQQNELQAIDKFTIVGYPLVTHDL